MMNYVVHVHVNGLFSKEKCLSMFLDWLEHSKNRMNHLVIDKPSSFVYQENRKLLKIQDFSEFNTFGIQFTTSDNDRNAQFVVELMYNDLKQTVDCFFYKELNSDSRYVEAVSMPKVFVNLLNSDYVCPDKDLQISSEPRFIKSSELMSLMNSSYELPIVVLNRNKRCIVNPFKLAKRLFGLAHVVCVYTKQELQMKIVYPDNTETIIDLDTELRMIGKCFDVVLNHAVLKQHVSFDDMVKHRLHQQMMSSDELTSYYKESIEEMQNEVAELQQLVQMSSAQLYHLRKQKEELEQILKTFQKDCILVSSENNDVKKQLVINLIHKKIRSLADYEVYRKRDVLTSIAKENDYD